MTWYHFIVTGSVLIWASEQEFSSCSVCLVLASHRYEESDYIRSYADFLEYLKNG